MTIEKKSKQYFVRELFTQLLIVLVGFASLFSIMNQWVDISTGVTLFIFAFLCSVVISFITINSYKCPNCTERLNAPNGWWHKFSGRKILFYCPDCDVNWDFRLTGHED